MAKPKVLAFIDFDADVTFTQANDEITSDVIQLDVTRGKNLLKQKCEASMLNLVLLNDDHRYTPTNTASPLYPGALPSPECWVLVGYPVDDFNAANGTTLSGRKPSHDDKFAVWEGDVTVYQVDTNQLKGPTDGTAKSCALDFSETDCFVGVKLTWGSPNKMGLILRWTDNSNYLLIYPDGTNMILAKRDAGVLSTIASAAQAWTTATTKWVFAEMHGDVVRVSVDNTFLFSSITTFNNTATKHGVGGTDGGVGASRWEDFGGWRSVFKGRVDTIHPRPDPNKKYCYMRAFDDMERMASHLVYKTAPAAPATAKNILDAILDAVNASTPNRILAVGTTLTNDANHEHAMGRDGLTEAYQVQDDDVGLFFIDGSGYYRYESSDHRELAPHDSVIRVWRADRLNNDETDIEVAHPFEWDDGKERVENEGYFIYHRISRTTAVQVWRLEASDKPPIGIGKTLTFLAVGEGDVIANPITPDPVAFQDYRVNTLADNTGTDMTPNVVASLVSGFEGNYRSIQLVNNSGLAGFVTFLRLRADKGVVTGKTAARAEESQSITNIGRRRFQHTALHIDRYGEVGDLGSALDRVTKRVDQRMLPRERIICDMYNLTRANLMQMIHRSMGDTINLIYGPMDIDDDYWIERQILRISDGGLLVHATWELQQSLWGYFGRERFDQAVFAP